LNLYIYSDRYAKDIIYVLKNNDYLVLQDSFSICTWKWLLKYKQINTKINIVTVDELLEGELDNVKFDYIVGNPPYQDGSKKSDKGRQAQNKIYPAICKKAISLLSPNGTINFITPTSITRLNKKFSLLSLPMNVKEVDFSINSKFNVGVTVCSWIVQNTPKKKNIKIIGTNGSEKLSSTIYDIDRFNEKFIYMFNKMYRTPVKDRMFTKNNVGTNLSKEKTEYYKHKILKLQNGKEVLSYYTGKTPILHNRDKLFVPSTKMFRPSSLFTSKKDFDMNYLCTLNKNKENIESFIFSKYFIELTNTWKLYKNVGFTESVIYLPKFDTSKHWDNKSVKEFLENI